MRSLVAIAVLMGLVGSGFAQGEAKKKLTEAAPTFLVIDRLDEDEAILFVTRPKIVIVTETKTKPLKVLGFAIGTMTWTDWQPHTEFVRARIDLKKWKVMNKTGEIIATEDALQKLHAGDTIMESPTSDLPHSAYLNALHADVLILVPK